MASMGLICNHIAAALCRISYEAGTDKCSMCGKTCEWLPNRKNVNPIKIKYVDLNRQDFCKREKKVKRLLTTP